MSVIDEIAAERARQVAVEGWMFEHDDAHTDGSLAQAAAAYAAAAGLVNRNPSTLGIIFARIWPRTWSTIWFKPKTPRRDLIRAGALIVAEIERLDRADWLECEKEREANA